MRTPSRHTDPSHRRYDRLESKLKPLRDALGGHWVYPLVQDRESLHTFMESHVFAVWDFMTLLKTLQRQLTCTETPWVPPKDRDSARLINEIVLSEESDEVRPGVFMSHLELYMGAMEEVGADRHPIDRFLQAMHKQCEPIETLAPLHIPAATKNFVATTIDIANGESHEVAAAFLFGREAIIPGMFKELLVSPLFNPWVSAPIAEHIRRGLRSIRKHIQPQDEPSALRSPGSNMFRLYLERHIEVNGDSHGPMAARLLMHLCDKDPTKWAEAEVAAMRALRSRHALWDGVAKSIISGEIEGWNPEQLRPVLVLPAKPADSSRSS